MDGEYPMASTMTIGRRFILTSGALILLSMVLAAAAWSGFARIGDGVHSLATDTVPGIRFAGAMGTDMATMGGNQLRHIVSSSPEEMKQLESTIDADRLQFAQDMKRYEGTINEEADRQNFAKLAPLVQALDKGWQDVLPVSRKATDNTEALKLYEVEVRPNVLELQDAIATIVAWNGKGADATIAATTGTVSSSLWLTGLMAASCLALGVGLSWFMIRGMKRELTAAVTKLSEGAVQIAAAASQVASASQSLAQGSSEQAASLEETSSTTEEINSMAVKNTDNAGVMTRMVAESQLEFVATNRQLGEMVTAMDEIDASSGKISKIIKVIDEIAFQTNILALNAAVEAARAGEAGMGFAVVADEVRNLAQRCAQAAKDTADLIEESIGKSGSGKTKVGLAASAVQRMTDEFTKIKTLVDEVSHGSMEQTDGISQVRKALSQMEQVSQSSAASAEEGAAAAEQLNAQSEGLKEIVFRLNSMAGVDARAGSSRPTSPSGR
jgi:methyl-accepting chemotaxis protein/methyl-accepting chemotaxis protein-1 (serine sensor receptor)